MFGNTRGMLERIAPQIFKTEIQRDFSKEQTRFVKSETRVSDLDMRLYELKRRILKS